VVRINVTVESTGLEARLASAARKLDNLNDMLTEFGEMGEAAAKRSFTQSATPGGAAWPSLAASTWRSKTSGRMMWETGSLAGSFAASPPSGNAVEVSSAGVPYAIYHHTGTRKMPARRSLPLPSYLKPKMSVIARRHLAGLI